ncbi:MAG: hypothetical protein ACOZAO_03175 [Patescibacteria group bacterium]
MKTKLEYGFSIGWSALGTLASVMLVASLISFSWSLMNSGDAASAEYIVDRFRGIRYFVEHPTMYYLFALLLGLFSAALEVALNLSRDLSWAKRLGVNYLVIGTAREYNIHLLKGGSTLTPARFKRVFEAVTDIKLPEQPTEN